MHYPYVSFDRTYFGPKLNSVMKNFNLKFFNLIQSFNPISKIV